MLCEFLCRAVILQYQLRPLGVPACRLLGGNPCSGVGLRNSIPLHEPPQPKLRVYKHRHRPITVGGNTALKEPNGVNDGKAPCLRVAPVNFRQHPLCHKGLGNVRKDFKDVKVYALRESDELNGDTATIENMEVVVNFFGYFLTESDLDWAFANIDYQPIYDWDYDPWNM